MPNQQLVSQWRECIAIKRQWEKGTLKHRLINYVMDYDKKYFLSYIITVICEMINRNIKYQEKYYAEMIKFCGNEARHSTDLFYYPEHNDRYLRECIYNLEEKATRGIITKQEWQKIYEKYKDKFDLWKGE